ncbi:MAG: Do family serine endopeptidase [Planctomycetales bacterium]|nr:Do family serine endopeptidase [Planctomycetales bacterium]
MAQSSQRQPRLALATAALLLGLAALISLPRQPATAASAGQIAADVASAKSLSTAFRAAAEKVLPAVVTIETRVSADQVVNSTDPGASDPFGERNPLEGTPFEDLFKNMPNSGPQGFRSPPRSDQVGLGSGVIIDPAGVILTNNHVVAGGDEVKVRLSDGREFKAASVLTDPKTDLAIIRIDGATGLTAAPLGDSDRVEIGDWVLALGQPFGLESTVTAGIVSATHRGIGIAARENFIQTDAAINPGNSGGPLVNLDGQVVGINTAISSRSGGNNGVGFAVPANLAHWVSSQLLADGVVHRAYLGVGIQPLTQDIATQFGVAPREGVVVTQVAPDTPAAKMGLHVGDVITKLDNKAVGSAQDLQLLVEQSQLGTTHPLQIVRNGKALSLAFSPEAQPADYGARRLAGDTANNGEAGRPVRTLGMALDQLTPEVAQQLGLDGATGVVITAVEPNSPAARAGLEPGMVIRQIGRRAVGSVSDAQAALTNVTSGKGVLLLVQTDAGTRFVVIEN